jgi:hypothetical protein
MSPSISRPAKHSLHRPRIRRLGVVSRHPLDKEGESIIDGALSITIVINLLAYLCSDLPTCQAWPENLVARLRYLAAARAA